MQFTLYCYLMKYADDTKSLYRVNNKFNARGYIETWTIYFVDKSSDWQIILNLDKCHIMHFEDKIEVSEEKILGVMISNTGAPCLQVTTAALKGNQVLGKLLCSFTYRNKVTFVKLYKKYVRPHLENCIQAWCPWLIQDIELLENAQMRAVHATSGIKWVIQRNLHK